jgi:hypothetical protein
MALNLSEKLRLFVISVSYLQGWIHLSTLSNFAGPLHYAMNADRQTSKHVVRIELTSGLNRNALYEASDM